MTDDINSLKEKFGELEENFKAITEKIPLGIFIIQYNLIKYVNKPITRILGYSINEIMNWSQKEFLKIFLPQDTLFVEERINRIFLSGREFIKYYITRIITKSKRIKWVEIYSKFINYNGKKALMVIFIELTKKRKAETKLIKIEKKLEDRIKKLNTLFQFFDILDKQDIKVEEIIFRTLDILPSIFQYPKLIFSRIKYDNEQYTSDLFKETEWRIETEIKIDDKLLYLEVCYMENIPFLEEEKKLLTYIGKRLKIKFQQKMAEEKLKKSKEKIEETLNLLPDIVFELDENLNINYINKAAFEKFGYSDEEFKIGINFSKLFPSIEFDKVMENIEYIFEGKNLGSKEYLLKKKDGKNFWGRIHIRPIYKDDEIIGIRGVISDISQQKRAEKARIRKVTMVNNKIKEIFSSFKKDLKPSISKNEIANIIFFLEDWHDKFGPYLKYCFPQGKKYPFSMEDIALQLYNGIVSVYGQANITEAQGILLNIDNIKMSGYIFFDSLPDLNFRGGEHQYMLGIIAPKINYFASLKLNKLLKEISIRIKENKSWNIDYYWKRILTILSS